MFPHGLSVVSGVVHWMVVRLGLILLHNVLVQPKQTIKKEVKQLDLCQDQDDVSTGGTI